MRIVVEVSLDDNSKITELSSSTVSRFRVGIGPTMQGLRNGHVRIGVPPTTRERIKVCPTSPNSIHLLKLRISVYGCQNCASKAFATRLASNNSRTL